MNTYKTLLISIIISLIAGLYAGYKLAINKHNKLLIDIQNQHLEIYQKEQAKLNEYKAIAEKNYQDYLAASNREPDVIERSVYVKAACPDMPTSGGGGMGNEPNYNRAELHPETTKRITAVTSQATSDVLKCQAQLTSLQQKIILFNKER